MKHNRPWFDALLWLSLPTAVNALRLVDQNGSKILGLAVLLVILFNNILLKPALSISRSKLVTRSGMLEQTHSAPVMAMIIFTLVMVPCVFRGLGEVFTFSNVLATAGMLILVPMAMMSSLIQAHEKEDKIFIINATILSLPLYVIANMVAYVGGFRGGAEDSGMLADERVNQTLGLVGIHIARISFPLSSGTNVFGAVAALATLICGFYALVGKSWLRAAGLVLFPATAAGLILTDARGAAIATIAAGLLAMWMGRKPKHLHVLYAGIAVTPFVPSIAYRAFDFANTSTAFAFLVRPGSQGARLGVGTGRGEIWKTVTSALSDFEPMQLIGYGAYGHYQSGISAGYGWAFNDFGKTIMGCHNSYLQYLLDAGYVGAIGWIALLLVFTYFGQKVLEKKDVPLSVRMIFTSFIILLVLQSQTETFGTIYTSEILTFMTTSLLAFGFLVGAPATKPKPRHGFSDQRFDQAEPLHVKPASSTA